MTPSLHKQAHDAIQNSILTQEPVFIEPQTDSDFDEIHGELVVWMNEDCKAFMGDDGIFSFWQDHPNHGTWEVRMLHPKAARVQN
tara:strand:+ start:544 stop:798 length:255 start_codon:yes stop_codon:yes gene_type:complete